MTLVSKVARKLFYDVIKTEKNFYWDYKTKIYLFNNPFLSQSKLHEKILANLRIDGCGKKSYEHRTESVHLGDENFLLRSFYSKSYVHHYLLLFRHFFNYFM